MKIDRTYLLLLALLYLSCRLQGQGNSYFKIVGNVFDHQGQPLPGATIKIKDTNNGDVTGSQGEFVLTVEQQGIYIVEISTIGYKKEVKSVDVNIPTTRLAVRLKEEIAELAEVVVRAKSEARDLELSAKAVQVIETREVKLKSADLGEVMAKMEGVNVQRSGGLGSNVRFSLNGLSGDQIRFFYNGIPLNFTPYAFGIANVPINMIDRVEVYKGVVPIQFGADALGGGVNLVSPKIYDGFAGAVSYQVGSFNTHRITTNANYLSNKTGMFVTAGGFFDYTDNNYRVDARKDIKNEDGSPTGQSTVIKARRFHDAYRAYGANLKIGFIDQSWADEISLEGYYGNYNNEVQNSQAPGLVDLPQFGFEDVVFSNPFGDVVFTSYSQGVNLNYVKTLGDRFDLDLKLGYNYTERVSIDTSSNQYDWAGEVERIRRQPGEFGLADHLITLSESVYARPQLSYRISDKHLLKLSVAPTYAYRTGDDLLVEGEFDPALSDGHLFDLVTGIEYTANFRDKKWQNIAFVKNYRQNIRIESIDPNVEGVFIDKRSVSSFGAGNGLRYTWSPRFFTKLSYEYAYRLPRQDEIFGNGQLIFQNLELRPESSHNVNLQWSYTNKSDSQMDWQLQGNFFLRQIDDLILLIVGANDFGSFQNVWSATSQGFEWGGRLKNLIKGLTISANTTYQEYLNTSRTGPFESFKADRIPNTPYFLVNGTAEYQWEDLFKKQDKLAVFWDVRFVNAFFVSWESSGRNFQQFKNSVPDQTTHAMGITHRMKVKKIQNAFTIEVQNLTDAKVFDLFGVQRPGRAFYVKSTIQF